ncbi:hypothetical protein, conserved [Eimeria brunetti]|uniref:Uncharacterized protein n=1 Tax=Eimeria brunetti TaxID=51314 RepID=U6LQ08_9EIME|nr:hypothetical protein, conserved [Eimeria brunetti]
MEADIWASVSWGPFNSSAAAGNEELKVGLLGGVARSLELLLLDELQQQQQHQHRQRQTEQRQQQQAHRCTMRAPCSNTCSSICICGCTSPCLVSVQQQEAAAAVAAGLLRRVYVQPVASLVLSTAPTGDFVRSSAALLLPAEEARQWQEQQQLQQQQEQPQQQRQWHLLQGRWRGPSLQASGDLCLLVDVATAAEATHGLPATPAAAEAAVAAREAIAAEFVGPVALLLHRHVVYAARSSSSSRCCCCCMALLAAKWLPVLVGSTVHQQLALLRSQGLAAAATELMEQKQQMKLMIPHPDHNTSTNRSSANSSSTNNTTASYSNSFCATRNSGSASSSSGGFLGVSNKSSRSTSGLFLSTSSRTASGEVPLTRGEAAKVQEYFSTLEMMDVDECGNTPAGAPLPVVSLLQQECSSSSRNSSSSSSSSSSAGGTAGTLQNGADLLRVALESAIQTPGQQQQGFKSVQRQRRERIAAEVIQRLATKPSSSGRISSISNNDDVSLTCATSQCTTARAAGGGAGGMTAACVSSPTATLHLSARPSNAHPVSPQMIPALINSLPDFLDKRMQAGRLGELLAFTKIVPGEVCKHFGFQLQKIVQNRKGTQRGLSLTMVLRPQQQQQQQQHLKRWQEENPQQ